MISNQFPHHKERLITTQSVCLSLNGCAHITNFMVGLCGKCFILISEQRVTFRLSTCLHQLFLVLRVSELLPWMRCGSNLVLLGITRPCILHAPFSRILTAPLQAARRVAQARSAVASAQKLRLTVDMPKPTLPYLPSLSAMFWRRS